MFAFWRPSVASAHAILTMRLEYSQLVYKDRPRIKQDEPELENSTQKSPNIHKNQKPKSSPSSQAYRNTVNRLGWGLDCERPLQKTSNVIATIFFQTLRCKSTTFRVVKSCSQAIHFLKWELYEGVLNKGEGSLIFLLHIVFICGWEPKVERKTGVLESHLWFMNAHLWAIHDDILGTRKR